MTCWITQVSQYLQNFSRFLFPADYDTDEETDHLLQKQYQKDQNVDIPELSQPPVNRSAQVNTHTHTQTFKSHIYTNKEQIAEYLENIILW